MSKAKKVEKLDKQIEELELAELEPKEIERAVKAFSSEGVDIRRTRKKVRYQLYRLRAEAFGQSGNVSKEGFKEKFEEQAGFQGWKNFATNWDVSMSDPYLVVSRHTSEAEEWENVVASKFPQIKPGGQIVYPDLQVKDKVMEESKKRADAKKGVK